MFNIFSITNRFHIIIFSPENTYFIGLSRDLINSVTMTTYYMRLADD